MYHLFFAAKFTCRKLKIISFIIDGGRKKFTKSGLKDHLEMMEDD